MKEQALPGNQDFWFPLSVICVTLGCPLTPGLWEGLDWLTYPKFLLVVLIHQFWILFGKGWREFEEEWIHVGVDS